MAVRRGSRETFFSPGEGQLRQRAAGSSCGRREPAPRRAAAMVSEPMSSVSSRPRWFSSRSVKTWPRSRSARELDLVDRHEGQVEVARHRLDGRDPVARLVAA